MMLLFSLNVSGDNYKITCDGCSDVLDGRSSLQNGIGFVMTLPSERIQYWHDDIESVVEDVSPYIDYGYNEYERQSACILEWDYPISGAYIASTPC